MREKDKPVIQPDRTAETRASKTGQRSPKTVAPQQGWLEEKVQALYEDTLNEAIPDELLRLLGTLDKDKNKQ